MMQTFAKRGLFVLLGLASLALLAVLISSVFTSQVTEEPVPLESSSTSSSIVQPPVNFIKSNLVDSTKRFITPLRLGVGLGIFAIIFSCAIGVAVYFLYFAVPEPVAEPIVKDVEEEPEEVKPTDEPVTEQTHDNRGRIFVGMFSGIMFCSFVIMMGVLVSSAGQPTNRDYLKLGMAFFFCLVGLVGLFVSMLYYPEKDGIGMLMGASVALLLLAALFFYHGKYRHSMGSLSLGLISFVIWYGLTLVI